MTGLDLATLQHWAVPALALLASALTSAWFRRYRAIDSRGVVWKVIAAGLAAARLAFVLQNLDTYRGAPLSIFDLRDGGMAPMAGLFAALVLGSELTRKDKAQRRPLLFAVLAGTTVWVAGAVATLDFAPARVTVPLAEVRRLDGAPVQLRTFTTKPMVLNLWASWCPPCRREMPALADAQRRHPGVAFVFVNQGESASVIRQFLASQGLDLENVFTDRAGEVARRSGAFAFPTTLFFDREGRLSLRHVGELSPATLDEQLGLLTAAPH